MVSVQGQMQPYQSPPPYGLSGALQLLGQTPSNANGNPNATTQFSATATPGARAGSLAGGLRGANQAANAGIKALNPWVNQGISANDQQAALSGAMGPEAQAQAYAQFRESPGQQFLREQGERAVMRNAAAMGGLGGGNVMKELTRYGQGMAAQDLQNQFSRLGSVADRGMQGAGLQTNLYDTKANAATAWGNQQAQLKAAAIGAGGSVAAAQVAADAALKRDAGRYAYDAGLKIGNNIQGTTSSLANFINQQGSGLSDIYGNTVNNQANLLVGGGRDTSTSLGNLATLLSGTRTGSAQQVAGLPGIPGTQNTNGLLQGIGNAAMGIGLGASALKSATAPSYNPANDVRNNSMFDLNW